MRILYVASKYDYGRPEQGLSFEHYNFFDCLHRLGHDILYFDFMTLMQRRGRSWMNQRLAEVAAVEKPDLIFTFLAGEELDKSIIRRISESGRSPTVNWFADDHWRYDHFSKVWAPCFNWAVTTAQSAVPKYAADGYGNVIKSQWGCNHFLYRKLDLPLKYDVTFVGQPHGSRRYMVHALRQAGVDVRCWGTGWENGRLTQEEMIAVFNQSRINLNFSNASQTGGAPSLRNRATMATAKVMNFVPFGRALKDRRRKGKVARLATEIPPPPPPDLQPQIKGRNFEVPGCGGLILSGYADNLDEYYDIGQEVVCFNGVNELVEKVKYLLAHEEERAAMAGAGHRRTLAEHTYARRLTDVFRQMGLHTSRESAGFSDQARPGTVEEVA